MRRTRVVVVLLASLAAGACQAHTGGRGRQTETEWTDDGQRWAGVAVPTGDWDTSVLALEKTIPVNVEGGDDVDYTIRVTNITKDQYVPDVVVTDDMKASGFEAFRSEPSCWCESDRLTWKLGRLAPGEVREIHVRGTAAGYGGVPPCASVTYGADAPPAPKREPARVVVRPTMVPRAGLAMTASAPPDTCLFDDIPIRFTVKNTGDGACDNVRVATELPEGWTVEGKRNPTYEVGSLKPGASKEMTARARATKTGSYTWRGKATGAEGLAADASATTNVHQAALSITEAVEDGSISLGRGAKFMITVKNTSDWTSRGVTVKSTMMGADAATANDGGTASGPNVTWNVGDLGPGESKTVSATARKMAGGTIESNSTASGGCAQPVSASARANVAGIPAVLLENVDDPDPVVVGSMTTYTIRVTNQGSAPDSDIVVACEMEDAVAFVSAGGATVGTHTGGAAGGSVKFAALPRLNAKEAATWTVVVRGVKPADSRFKISVTTKETTRPIEKSEATRIYE